MDPREEWNDHLSDHPAYTRVQMAISKQTGRNGADVPPIIPGVEGVVCWTGIVWTKTGTVDIPKQASKWWRIGCLYRLH